MKRSAFCLIVLLAAAVLPLRAQLPLIKLVPDVVQQNNAFGDIVALDGAYAAVGAFLDTNANGEKAGAVYVFQRDGEAWRQQARLVGSGVGPEDRFGEAVALDGNYLLAANRSDEGGGAVYVFEREGDTWSEQARLTVDDLQAGEQLGTVVLYQDPYVFVGGSSIRVFKREEETWVYQTKLTTDAGEDLRPKAVSGDVLAASRSFLSADGSGSVQELHLFQRDGDAWAAHTRLDGEDVGTGAWRRLQAALSGDDLAIGARADEAASATIYLYRRAGDAWIYQTEFTTHDPATVDFSITEMALSGDVLLVGDNNQDPNGEASGAAYLFRRDGEAWEEHARLVPGDGVAHDRFGIAVAIDDGYLLIGQDGHQVGDTVPTGFGAAYVYALADVLATGVEVLPAGLTFALGAPYPNPFHTATTLTLRLDRRQAARVEVYDLLGRRVALLHDGVLPPHTEHHFTVHADGWPGGMYVIRATAGSGVAARSLALVK